MDYFLVRSEDVREGRLTLRGEESKHLVRVVRKHVGERIFCTDGNDAMYEAEIVSVGKDSTECNILSANPRFNELPVDVTLAVSLLKNPARFDWLVEKATELGVRTVVPILCERTISRKDKHTRLEKIAIAAVKQSGRSFVPRINETTRFEQITRRAAEFDLCWIAHEQAVPGVPERSDRGDQNLRTSLLILIGPEGGFSQAEVSAAEHLGIRPLSLGPRRLRTETAALVAVNELVRSVSVGKEGKTT